MRRRLRSGGSDGGRGHGRDHDKKLISLSPPPQPQVPPPPPLAPPLATVTVLETYDLLQSRKQTAGTKAMCNTLVLLVGVLFLSVGMNMIRDLYPTQDTFLFGSPDFERAGALTLCTRFSKSILYAYPGTVSEALSHQAGITNVIIGCFMSIAALFVVTSGIGQPSSFPMQSNHFGCIFNVARVMCPVIAAFCIPKIRSLGVVTQLLYPSASIEMYDHCFVAAFGWIGASILELISSIINLVSFFRQQPWGDKFIPSEYEMGKPIGWVDTLYKSLWVGFTFARGVLSISTLYIFLFLFIPLLRITTGIGAVDDCEVLRNIKSIALEWNMSGLMGSLYILLALSQLCESSGRRLSGLFYILPIMVLSCIPIGTLLSNLFLSFNIEENYLDVVNMPGGQLSKSMIDTMNAFLDRVDPGNSVELGYSECTAKLQFVEGCFGH